MSELGHYDGVMTGPESACANWQDLNDHGNPIYSDIFNLNNFPDESYATVANKCRLIRLNYIIFNLNAQ